MNIDYQRLLDDIDTGLFFCDKNGRIRKATQRLAAILGYEKSSDLEGLRFMEELFYRKEDRFKFNGLLEKNKQVKNFRVILKRNNDTKFAAKINARIIYDPDAGVPGIVGTVQDITRQLQNELELKKIKEEKGKSPANTRDLMYDNDIRTDYFRDLGHEMRTPMNSISGFLTLIENKEYKNEKELREYAHSARITAASLMDIMNNFMDISKLESGEIQLLEQKFSLKDEAEKIDSLITPFSYEKNVKIKIKIDPETPVMLYGDGTRYRQVVVQLIKSALAEGDSGKIDVAFSGKENNSIKATLKCSIKVPGAGESLEKFRDLFTRDFSRDELPNYRSSEIWLLIVREFLELMKGKISFGTDDGALLAMIETEFGMIEDKAPEVDEPGDEVIITDENSEEESPKSSPAKSLTENIPLNGKKKILLVEDDQGNQRVELEILRNAGYEVIPRTSGRGAVEEVQKGGYDLVLMDIGMEDMDGLSATQKIREMDAPMNNIPIIAVTAHCSMDDRRKCLDAGMDDYISKPINFKYLKMTIEQWLSRRPINN